MNKVRTFITNSIAGIVAVLVISVACYATVKMNDHTVDYDAIKYSYSSYWNEETLNNKRYTTIEDLKKMLNINKKDKQINEIFE